MKDYESLLERIRQSPYDHLGRRSVSEIAPYINGYDDARRHWGLPGIQYRLKIDKFREWLDSKVHLCRQNLQTFCLLLAEDEKNAFDLFFEFHDSALEDCRDDLVQIIDEELFFNPSKAVKNGTLVEFILHPECIRKRPAMYFGNYRQLSGLWAWCSGYLWAEKDLGIEDSSDAVNMELFQLWLDERFPLAKGQPWDKLFYFEALHSERWAMEQFYENFEMFLAGKSSDAPPKWVETAIENIKKSHEKKQEN